MTAVETAEPSFRPDSALPPKSMPQTILDRIRQQDFAEFRTQTLERMEGSSGISALLVRNTFSCIRLRDGEAAGYRSLAGMLFAYTVLEELLGEDLPLPPGVQADFAYTAQFGHSVAIEHIAKPESVKPSEEMFQGIFGPSHPELVGTIEELEYPESRIGAIGMFLLYRERFMDPVSVTIDVGQPEPVSR